MIDITTIGEILIDLTQTGVDEHGILQFAANPGGAPANLAVAAAKLGAACAFLGCVGNDSFGQYLLRCLKNHQVNTDGVTITQEAPTTMAVVSVDASGERSFSFYRKPGSDTRLRPEDIPSDTLKNTKFLHFGSVSLTQEPCKTATLYAVHTARRHGAIISYDPNYRANLWPDEATAISQIKEVLPLTDVLKVSDEELLLLTGTSDLEKGSRLLQEYGVRLILVTLGGDGAFYCYNNRSGIVPGMPCTVADTNGAGDTFFGAFLSRLCQSSTPLVLSPEELIADITFANIAASLTTSRHGAIPAMPNLSEVLKYL